ncbi:hypothetical protein OS127_10840 [Corynebacterium sp. P6129]|uniref:hypothetical protein n=1 Tax=Corynebacterium antarcticum TaxID=2800405 RepID=UPI002260FFCF|nr:hypothetical protein [Corynebacterium antarcticum]MCX7493002.1 hypothetical protein [Corynebacterium antarcticum]
MEKVKTPLNAPRLLGLLLASGALTLPACQSPPHPPTDAGATPSTVDSNDSAGEHTTEVDLSSATSNADGSAIVFDPLEVGKNLPDPCVELSEDVLRDVGFVDTPERETIGLNDHLPGKGITCNFGFTEKYDGIALVGIDSDTVSKEYLMRRGFFIRNAPESIVPNAYFYTYSPTRGDNCSIGAHTPRGRLGIGITG